MLLYIHADKRGNIVKQINVAIVGLSFGLEFVPIYLDHPNVAKLVVVDQNEKLLKVVQDRYNFPKEQCYTDIEKILTDPGIDAVHLVTPPATHAPLSIKTLNAGKHCACTIPMGMSIDELYGVINARRTAKKRYMFMETTAYQREYLYVKELHDAGKLGKIQYMTCAHYQDMEGWPSYWDGFPPLMHPTHAVAPCFLLLDKYPVKVYGRGSGKVREALAKQYGCPFSFEAAFIEMEGSDVTVEMERFLYGVARSYAECFRVYGENMSYEWQQLLSEAPVLYKRTGNIQGRGGEITEERITIPDYASRLPKEIAKFTVSTVYNNENSHLSFKQGGGHGGSHPHLIHEFVTSIIEDRPPMPDDILGAYWTGVGICAHQSAMAGGKVIEVPAFKELA